MKGRACNLLLAFSQRNKVGNAKFGGKKKKNEKFQLVAISTFSLLLTYLIFNETLKGGGETKRGSIETSKFVKGNSENGMDEGINSGWNDRFSVEGKMQEERESAR